MKILIIDQTAMTFSGRTRWRKLAEYSGQEIHVLVPERWVENYVEYRYSGIANENVTVHRGNVLFPGYENRGMYFSSIFQIFRMVRPDIILLMEEPYSIFSLQAVMAKRLFAPHARLIFYTWDNLTYNFRHVYRPSFFYKAIDRITLRHADGALCANREAMEVLKSKGFDKSIRLVYPGIDTGAFQRKRHNGDNPEEKREFRIGYVGRMLRQKGLEVLIRAFRMLPGDTRLILLGSGPYLVELLKLSDALGVRGRLEHRDSVAPEEVPLAMQSVDVLVLPSLSTHTWKEQFGRVLVEGMAAGCVIIGSDSGAIPEVIGDAGIIVPEGNPDALAEAMTRVREDGTLRESLRKAGYEQAGRFSIERFVENIHSAFSE